MEENFGIGLIRRIFLSGFSDQSSGQAVDEKIEFLFKKDLKIRIFSYFYVLKPDVRACTQDIAPMAKIDPK